MKIESYLWHDHVSFQCTAVAAILCLLHQMAVKTVSSHLILLTFLHKNCCFMPQQIWHVVTKYVCKALCVIH